MKILTVEDDNIIREGISEYLSEFGYTVIQAKDGREALSKFNSDINLVILDIQIPFINGLEVLKEIRKKSNLPILILTAFSDEEYKIDAFTNLADGYIEKPFSLPVLKARIDSLIKKNYGHLEKFEYKNLSVNFNSYTAKINGEEIPLLSPVSRSVTVMGRVEPLRLSSTDTTPAFSDRVAARLGLRASNSSSTRGRPCVISLPATPPVWKVRMVSCVPGSPMDWAAMMPTASPMPISVREARLLP